MENIELSKKYCNIENILIEEVYKKYKKNDNYKIQGHFDFQYTHKIIFSSNENCYIRECFTLPFYNDFTHGFSNLKIIGNYNNIKFISINIGDVLVDRIYPSITKDLTLQIFNNTILLSSNECPIQITVEYTNTNIIFIWDCLKITNFINLEEQYDFIFNSTLYAGTDIVTNENNCIKNNFNNLIYKINVYLSQNYNGPIYLLLNNCDKIELNKINDKYWNYNFNYPINFSIINDVNFLFENIEMEIKLEVEIFANFITVGSFIKNIKKYKTKIVF